MNSSLKKFINWEFGILFVYYLMLYYPVAEGIDIKFLHNSVIHSSIALLIISLPIMVFGLYFFSKNKDFKSLIRNFINSPWQPGLVIVCITILEVISILVEKSIYKINSVTFLDNNQPTFFVSKFVLYNFFFFWFLMIYITIYQLFGRSKHALINFGLSILLVIIFLIACLIGIAR